LQLFLQIPRYVQIWQCRGLQLLSCFVSDMCKVHAAPTAMEIAALERVAAASFANAAP
jgi:hypothetical protein